MKEDEITISTVAVGEEADRELLSDIAEWGDGRSYFIRDAARVQQIFVEETQIALDATLVEEPFRPVVRQEARVLDGLDFAAAPELKGFVATLAKDTAEVLLEGPDEEPLLARWQYGLGRASMFTSDCKNRWAADWVEWDGYGKFWTQVVRDSMRRGQGAELEFEVARRGNAADVRLSLIGEDGAFPTGVAPNSKSATAASSAAPPSGRPAPAASKPKFPSTSAPVTPPASASSASRSPKTSSGAPISNAPSTSATPTSTASSPPTKKPSRPSPPRPAASSPRPRPKSSPRTATGWSLLRPLPLLAFLALLSYLLDLSVRRTPWLWTRLGRRLTSLLAPRPA